LIGGIIGGALTDRFGRRRLIIFGLVFSALSTLTLGFVDTFGMLFPLAVVIGLISNIASPAHQAMIADILPEDRRQEGFGILRITSNLSWIIGPTIAGLITSNSGGEFIYLFLTDAMISLIVATLFYFLIQETAPKPAEHEGQSSLVSSFAGYGKVLSDLPYVGFIFSTILMGLVYIQMYGSLGVFLRDEHGITTQGYGFILTTSAITVIVFQLLTSRLIRGRPPFLMMALASVFYAIGFGMYGFVGVYALFVAAMVIITIGEMIAMPTAAALAANFAPEAMRGRYMAVFDFTFAIPAAVGPAAAGFILDNYPRVTLWHIGALLCLLAALAFLMLHARLGKREVFAPVAKPATD
jgi:MFS family permease